MLAPTPLYAVPVVFDPDLYGESRRVQFRFPRSKRRRIRRKWSKDPRNWRWVESPAVIAWGPTLHMNRPAFDLLKRGLALTQIAEVSRVDREMLW